MTFCCMSCVYKREFSASFRGCLWCIHCTGGLSLRHMRQCLLLFVLDKSLTIDKIFFSYLIRNHAKCYFVFSGIIIMQGSSVLL